MSRKEASAATALLLVQIVERRTKIGLTPIEERQVPRRCGETDAMLALRCSDQVAAEARNDIKYKPALKRALTGRDWLVESVVV